jgi:hypothetical protein
VPSTRDARRPSRCPPRSGTRSDGPAARRCPTDGT